ncbi:Polygalacturonase [Bertholletia excelsa]
MATHFVLLVICIASFGLNRSWAITYDVTKFGAVGNGSTDDSQAFLQAWKAACGDKSGGTPTFTVPNGKIFFLNSLAFQGPCQSQTIQILGSLVAPSQKSQWSNCLGNSWISFQGINSLNVNGNGLIDAKGESWWHRVTPTEEDNPSPAMKFANCNGLLLSGLNIQNSPRNHISIDQCDGAQISALTINSPANSPNTDGLTCDDCIAVNTGCSDVNITGVSCGPGHGISVGSLGRGGSSAQVEFIRVQQCNFTNSLNGARIKTWPGGTGFAKNIFFDQISVNAATHPIVIDQHYCNGRSFCPEQTKAVQVSSVFFTNVRGTSGGKEAIKLDCSKNVPCQDIHLQNVSLTSTTPGGSVFATCHNAKGQFSSIPPVTCT